MAAVGARRRAASRRRAALRRRAAVRRQTPEARADRAFLGCHDTIDACRRAAQDVRLEREKALFFVRVAVTAPWDVRAAALVRADRFGAHLEKVVGSGEELLRSIETHEAIRRAIRKEIRRGWVSPTTVMPSGLRLRVDEIRLAVADAHGHAEGAVHAARAEVRAARSVVSRTVLRRYLWQNSASVLHRQAGLRAVFSAMPPAERLNWLHDVHSCLAESLPEARSRVAAGYLVAAPRTILTAWAMSRRRARAAVDPVEER